MSTQSVANFKAMARPIPWPAPVINATLVLVLLSICIFLFFRIVPPSLRNHY
jgi:hypothetical protein